MSSERSEAYYEYFIKIDDTFCNKVKKKNYLISPMEWALLESWKELGISVEIVIEGINISFQKNPKKIKTLFDCQETVLSIFAKQCQ